MTTRAIPIVTLLTDFGSSSHYVAQMKGVVLATCPNCQLVDISHEVPPQDIRTAAWTLMQAYLAFPRGTSHLVVVDPGVGSRRAMLAMECNGYRFVAPDNGVLAPIAADHPPAWVRSIDTGRNWNDRQSSTFHGRDFMGPVAAHLAGGGAPTEVGPIRTSWEPLELPLPTFQANTITGQVMAIDHFGNLITNLGRSEVQERRIRNILLPNLAAHEIPFARTYADHAAGSIVALVGSNECLEIAMVDGHAAHQLGAEIGQPVVLEF